KELEERKTSVHQDKEVDEVKWVHDASVDYRGRVPLRSSTGVWKAALFIISKYSSFYEAGVTTIMPLIGGFLADAYTGRFTMVLLSSIIYFMGLSLLTMSQFIPGLEPCNIKNCQKPRKVHEVVFFLAIYCVSLGTGGHKPCLQSFGADQFDDDHPEERKKKMSYFNLWNFALSCGLFLGVTVIVYIQDNVGWGAGSLILSIVMLLTIATFFMGRPYYRFRLPEGSPIIPMLQVLVAATRKRKLPHPPSPILLYEVPLSLKSRSRLLGHTDRLRFLDKAAILEPEEEKSAEVRNNPWKVKTMTEVEELKLVLSVIPIWFTSFPFGVCVAQTSTFFVKQGATMNRKITEKFYLPPASIYALQAVGMIISVIIYEKILVPILRKATGNERGINILKRIGIGMIFSVLSMSTAALVEKKRLSIAREEIGMVQGGKNVALTMSVFWLVPQFLILGLGDGFTLVGLQEYFYDQVPDSMRSLGLALYLSVIGVGSFLSSFLINTVDYVTDKGGKSWIGKDLNSSRLDKFFWLLAVINLLNLFVFVLLAKRYTYKKVQGREVVTDSHETDEILE
ncbi:hypothetical protein Tsubulata_049271, partial [Turnera subulata]